MEAMNGRVGSGWWWWWWGGGQQRRSVELCLEVCRRNTRRVSFRPLPPSLLGWDFFGFCSLIILAFHEDGNVALAVNDTVRV